MLTIRDATAEDAAACAAIYDHYVRDTVISFETVAPDADEMAARIDASTAWLTGEDAGRVVGYAYAGSFNPREAYRWSCTVSVYLEPARRRTGAGRALYEALFARLVELGYRRATAGITLPNEASVGLHSTLGFEPVGTFGRIGWKNDAWHDVAWMQRDL
ncbi:N-acetyltransferase family protein [Actinomycetospora endophytica]|uniref:N-acetyltransferase family protein n=1 Tax=Actinomycetospora endophytica TaxID=2291215 RepID=A0ABS8PAA0_9PSEU|nr:GNAT family N-acetyltransferase [Actinomycetospora endophytica]MCD2194336.1 N-acetyltransferase family protein [Actinomycetospora endophytica]